MRTKPSRTFVYLALVMVFVLVIGLIVVGMLLTTNQSSDARDITRNAYEEINLTTQLNAFETATAKAEFTPIYYTADMSPTAPVMEMSPMTATAWRKNLEASWGTATQIARSATPYMTPTYPYDPELYWQRYMEYLGLNTSGGPDDYARFFATETALVIAYQTAQHYTATPLPTLTMTASPTALATGTVVSIQGCVWEWAQQDLPEVTILAQKVLDEAGLSEVNVQAQAYGENCNDPMDTNKVQYFATMKTDFSLDAQVESLSDQATLTDSGVKIYTALGTIPEDSLPNRADVMMVTFSDSRGQSKLLLTSFDQVRAALDKGLRGAALLEALGGLR
jgi:hypothetical protein